MARKASVISGEGEQAREARWRKSSRSMTNGHCVEMARLTGGQVAVRDSQAADGYVLEVTVSAWMAFMASLCALPPGEAILPVDAVARSLVSQ